MKQVVQHLSNPNPVVEDVPAPRASSGTILVHTQASLVSAGTERMVVDFVEKNLLEKAKSRPDLVKQTVDKARTQGVLQTMEAVRNKLQGAMPLGYSAAGIVIDVGAGVSGFAVGDRVAIGGAGHAEIIRASPTLTAKIPDNVTFEQAAYSTLGAIALQGVRLADIALGERVAVIGLGLLGQLTVQLLRAAGCDVVGFDLQQDRADLALQLGATSASSTSGAFAVACSKATSGRGVDAVLITADTPSHDPVTLAAEVARDKGTVVAVGNVGTHLPRKPYFEKELTFRVSRSYGPGRYDASYEEDGNDYPFGYVRWTEQRNIGAISDLIGQGRLDVDVLTSHKLDINDAPHAYDIITNKTDESFLGVVLTYPEKVSTERTLHLLPPAPPLDVTGDTVSEVRLGVIGAGNYANATLLPIAQKTRHIALTTVVSGGGMTARTTADRFAFRRCSTDYNEVLADDDVNTVALLTRHNLHAKQAAAALDANKHVFVEKPLCLNEDELHDVIAAHQRAQDEERPRSLVVGYNRRFAPFVLTLRKVLDDVHEPLMINARVNAGFIPADNWTQNPLVGGGRLLGEGCHFIDLAIFLAGQVPTQVTTWALGDAGNYCDDNLQINLRFADGSMACIHYLANGDKGFGKELFEVFGGGVAARLDDYRSLTIRGPGVSIDKSARLRPDKGHAGCLAAFAQHLVKGGPSPIPFSEVVLSTATSLAAQRSLQTSEPVDIDWRAWR